MLSKKLAAFYAAALLALGLSSGTASAQCPIAQWTGGVPNINQLHIFCGEIAGNGDPKGYHSKVYLPPTNVVAFTGPAAPVANGIYTSQVYFNNLTDKFSTFFPDSCNQAQILASVRYAFANPIALPGAGTVGWGVGPSAPAAPGGLYCRGTNGNPFNIRLGILANGNINTAFPN
ncbi:hypothetical protein FHW58_001077 [Duganella sp. 1224]|uniref:EndoU domain-containing protein n=1 Tax=Duganella sp. 1224 TaxID=2587052 RepID=UPI0015C95516|nr:EndoU domain-containing protein [Duganella sp. 1224]NYE59925.1 hypothetical protein [Duganella sp. 1224]